MAHVWRQSAHLRLSYVRVILMGILLVLIGATGFYNIPGMIKESATGSHAVNSLYCAVMTLTTVGYGDICPSDKMTSAGKTFILLLSFSGLGMFLGPIMDLAARWQENVPGGMLSVASITVALGVFLFTWLEEMTQLEAAYFSVITGTTIGYGDYTPSSDIGKLAVMAYSILVINVVGGLLKPAKLLLERLCSEEEEEVKSDGAEKKKDD